MDINTDNQKSEYLFSKDFGVQVKNLFSPKRQEGK